MPIQRRMRVQLLQCWSLLLRASILERIFHLEVDWREERPDLRFVYYAASSRAEGTKRTRIQQKPILIETIYVF